MFKGNPRRHKGAQATMGFCEKEANLTSATFQNNSLDCYSAKHHVSMRCSKVEGRTKSNLATYASYASYDKPYYVNHIDGHGSRSGIYIYIHTVDGHNPAPLGNHGIPFFIGVSRGIIMSGFLRWCRISSIHSITYRYILYLYIYLFIYCLPCLTLGPPGHLRPSSRGADSRALGSSGAATPGTPPLARSVQGSLRFCVLFLLFFMFCCFSFLIFPLFVPPFFPEIAPNLGGKGLKHRAFQGKQRPYPGLILTHIIFSPTETSSSGFRGCWGCHLGLLFFGVQQMAGVRGVDSKQGTTCSVPFNTYAGMAPYKISHPSEESMQERMQAALCEFISNRIPKRPNE